MDGPASKEVLMPSATIVKPFPPLFEEARLAVAGFLARYAAAIRQSDAVDLRAFFAWCAEMDLGVFDLRRGHIELRARSMEERASPDPPSTEGSDRRGL